MSLFQFVAVKLCLYLLAGILLGNIVNPTIEAAIIITAAAFSFLVISFRITPGTPFGISAALATMMLGMLAYSISQPHNYPGYYGNDNDGKRGIYVLKISRVLRPTGYYQRYYAKVSFHHNKHTSGLVLLEIPRRDSLPVYAPDEAIRVFAAVKPIMPPLNPGDFNYREYLAKMGVHFRIRVGKKTILQSFTGKKTIPGAAYSVQEHLLAGLRKTKISQEASGVLQALLLGNRKEIDQDIKANYRDSGALHILALSGLHVGILLLFLKMILKPLEILKYGKQGSLLVQIITLWAFAFVSGWSPSVIRAVSMFSFLAYCFYLNRPANSYNILAISVLFILLVIDPKLLFQLGFQLSYAAVIGIFYVLPLFRELWRPKNRVFRKAYEIFSVSIAAQAGILPLSLYYFKQFPGLFFVTNLLLLPVLSAVLILGIIIVLLLQIVELPGFLISTLDYLVRYMNSVTEGIAGSEFLLWRHIGFDIPSLVILYIILFSLVFWLRFRDNRHVVLCLTSISVLSLWWLHSNYQRAGKHQLVIPHLYKEHILIEQKGMGMDVRIAKYEVPSGMDELQNMKSQGYKALRKDFPFLTRLEGYIAREHIRDIRFKTLGPFMRYQSRKIYFADSTGFIPLNGYCPDILVLANSPFINMDRMLRQLKPREVIADGSNAPWLVRRWEHSSKALGIRFYYTGDSGAYIF